MENNNNNSNMNIVIFAMLSMAVFMVWGQFNAPTQPVKKSVNKVDDKEKVKKTEASVLTKGETSTIKEKKIEQTPPSTNKKEASIINYDQKEELFSLENKDVKLTFSNYGASLKSFNLKGKKYTLDENKKEQIYILKEDDKAYYPLSFSIFKDKAEYLKNYAPFKMTKKDDKVIEFTFTNDAFKIIKTYTLGKEYAVVLNVKIQNLTATDQNIKLLNHYSSYYDERVEKTNIFGDNGTTFFYKTEQGNFERVPADEFKKELVKKELSFMGADDRYFIGLIKPSHKDTYTFKLNTKVIDKDKINNVRFTFESEPYHIKAGASLEYSYDVYNGPKILENLKEYGASEGIDYGYFAVISKAILWMLLGIYGFLGNYGLALIMLTLIVKLFLYPLTKSSYVSMHNMKKLKPEMDKLKEKYGNDKEKIGRETMALYKKHGVNPLGGCLPMLLQMPIWFGLYRAIQYSVELYNEPFFLWIQDLSVEDPYYILPITMGALMFVQQKMSSAGMDQAQAKAMLYIMPILFSVFMINLPAGLVLYIWVNTLVSILQQNYINRKLDKADAKVKAKAKTESKSKSPKGNNKSKKTSKKQNKKAKA